MPQSIHDDVDSLYKMESILSHPFLSLMGRGNWRSAQYQIQFEFMFSRMVLSQIITRDLEAGVKIHFQSSGNLFQHNREQHNINPFYLIGVDWRPCHIAWMEFAGVRNRLLFHSRDSVNSWLSRGNWIYSKHTSVLVKYSQDDRDTLWSLQQVWWPEDNIGHISNCSQS